MTVLEERYRKVLRMLPSSYRREWEDEMVATFLASMETDDPDEADYLDDFGRPSLSEVASVAALAVRLRLGGVEAPPRSFLWGEAVRRVALVGLLTSAALMTVFTLEGLWATGLIPWPPPPSQVLALNDRAPLAVWPRALWLCTTVLIPAYVALVCDNRRAARVLAALALVPPVVRVTSSTVDAIRDGLPMDYYSLALVVGGVANLLALAAFHREAPQVRRRPWFLAFGIAVGAGAVIEALFVTQNLSGRMMVDWPGVGCIAVVVTAIVHLARARAHKVAPMSSWSLTLALLALIALAQRAVSVLDYSLVDHPPGSYDALTAAAVVEALLVLAVLVPLVVLAARSLGRLPSAPVPTS